MIIKYFLVGVFCITQPSPDCVRVAGSVPYDTLQSCALAKNNKKLVITDTLTIDVLTHEQESD